ncbi:MAG TPA: phosphatidylserine/phosphatidylglycerophosphate/cardiolipin synthase family protein [Ktedonobacteraceae bacterium]|nr:phosphatidylserine/phosphatidylglycerophosphate/cardiolipin synthase family protein [Ktedonobacteraceae bacterium]
MRQPNKQRLYPKLLLLLLIGLLLNACMGFPNQTSPQDQSSSPNISGSGRQGIQVFVEPDAGIQPITLAIQAAQHSIWVEMYLLSNKKVIRALEEASNRGLDVRVMLELHPYGGGIVASQTLDKLQLAGVKVEGSNPAFALTHEKSMLIDGSIAFIMTSNFTNSALGGRSTIQNREYDLVDTNPEDVQSVISIFNADWNRHGVQLEDPNIVASPLNARRNFIALIDSTRQSLLIEAEEMQDTSVEQALVLTARRGVSIQVILPASSSGTSDSNSAGITRLRQSGIVVREDQRLYMHAKMMVADGRLAFVGSENISAASLDRNRELGLMIADHQVISQLQKTFQLDWADSTLVQVR